MFELLIQALFYGIVLAAVYGLVAMGFNLVAGVMNILNLAHGDFLTLGAYTAYWLWVFFNLNPIISLPISAVIGFITGIVAFYVLIKRVAFSPDNALIATFALSSIRARTHSSGRKAQFSSSSGKVQSFVRPQGLQSIKNKFIKSVSNITW